MKTLRKQPNIIADAIEFTLASYPASDGLKLIPEIKLAERLKVSRTCIRTALNILVHKGYLKRSRGSGTFVNGIIPLQDADSLPDETLLKNISQNTLFALNDVETNHLKRLKPEKTLTLGLCSTWLGADGYAPSAQEIMNGIVNRTEELGHRLVIHSVIGSPHRPIPLDTIAERMKKNPCDAYLTSYTWMESLEFLLRDSGAPAIYYYTQQLEIWQSNVLMLASAESMRKSIEVFISAGYTRIAGIFYAYDDGFPKSDGELLTEHSASKQYRYYLNANDLSYYKELFLTLDFQSIRDSLQQIINSEFPPEALYIADDHLCSLVTEALHSLGLKPGKDIAIIVQTNSSSNLSTSYDWSRMQFDLYAFGEILVDSLLRRINNSSKSEPMQLILPEWIPGKTHNTGRI